LLMVRSVSRQVKRSVGLAEAVFHSRLAEAQQKNPDRPRTVNSLEQSAQL
jgi:hypothetical protein